MSSKGHRWKVPNRLSTIVSPERRAAWSEAIRQGRLRNLPSLEERYWSKVKKGGPDECWEWIGTRNENGYGQLKVGGHHGNMVLAHRLGWRLVYGEEPELQVLHHCDNPPCQNPKHWFQGTHLDNMRDRDAKGRTAKGDRSGARTKPESFRGLKQRIPQKLTGEQVVEIRRLRELGTTLVTLAERFRVTPTMISRIARRLSWSHVP